MKSLREMSRVNIKSDSDVHPADLFVVPSSVSPLQLHVNLPIYMLFSCRGMQNDLLLCNAVLFLSLSYPYLGGCCVLETCVTLKRFT